MINLQSISVHKYIHGPFCNSSIKNFLLCKMTQTPTYQRIAKLDTGVREVPRVLLRDTVIWVLTVSRDVPETTAVGLVRTAFWATTVTSSPIVCPRYSAPVDTPVPRGALVTVTTLWWIRISLHRLQWRFMIWKK